MGLPVVVGGCGGTATSRAGLLVVVAGNGHYSDGAWAASGGGGGGNGVWVWEARGSHWRCWACGRLWEVVVVGGFGRVVVVVGGAW